jgi:hypothetical protein
MGSIKYFYRLHLMMSKESVIIYALECQNSILFESLSTYSQVFIFPLHI